jgi:hypothetical protein
VHCNNWCEKCWIQGKKMSCWKRAKPARSNSTQRSTFNFNVQLQRLPYIHLTPCCYCINAVPSLHPARLRYEDSDVNGVLEIGSRAGPMAHRAFHTHRTCKLSRLMPCHICLDPPESPWSSCFVAVPLPCTVSWTAPLVLSYVECPRTKFSVLARGFCALFQ